MAERLASLSVYNYIYAALIAFVVTYLIMKVKNFKKNIESRDELAMDYGHIDRNSVMERCIKMFPIETVVFPIPALVGVMAVTRIRLCSFIFSSSMR